MTRRAQDYGRKTSLALRTVFSALATLNKEEQDMVLAAVQAVFRFADEQEGGETHE